MKENLYEGDLILPNELPSVLNPKNGYLISCNNRITGDEVLHGVSAAMSMAHRKIRIEEMILEVTESGRKFTFEDMRRIQSDLLDIQSRESMPTMLEHVNFIKEKTLERLGKQGLKNKLEQAIQLLNNWDYRFNLESSAAPLAAAWEFHIYEHLHSFKIRSLDTRLSLAAPHTYDEFVYL